MKTYTIAALFIIAVALGSSTALPSDTSPTAAPEEDVNYVDWNGLIPCVGHGAIFNGRKTCQIGCISVCQQPGCGGYSKCEQIPNPGESSTYLHKYKCHCKSP